MVENSYKTVFLCEYLQGNRERTGLDVDLDQEKTTPRKDKELGEKEGRLAGWLTSWMTSWLAYRMKLLNDVVAGHVKYIAFSKVYVAYIQKTSTRWKYGSPKELWWQHVTVEVILLVWQPGMLEEYGNGKTLPAVQNLTMAIEREMMTFMCQSWIAGVLPPKLMTETASAKECNERPLHVGKGLKTLTD